MTNKLTKHTIVYYPLGRIKLNVILIFAFQCQCMLLFIVTLDWL